RAHRSRRPTARSTQGSRDLGMLPPCPPRATPALVRGARAPLGAAAAELLGLDAIAPQELVQVLAVHVGLSGRPRDVALGPLQQPLQVRLLEQLDRPLLLLAKRERGIELHRV